MNRSRTYLDPNQDADRPRLPRRAVVAAGVGASVLAVGAAALAVRRLRADDSVRTGPVAGPSEAPTAPTTSAGCPSSSDLRFDTALTAADGHQVPYSVSLPADYADGCSTYPVLYALHGRDESNATFLDDAESVRAAVRDGALADAVIVTADSNRDGRWEGRYDTDFVDELIPHVERTYRVTPGPAHRLLVGFSMGGHGAFRFALEHPQDFAAVWSVDGAMARSPEDYLEFLDRVRAVYPGDPQLRLVGGNLNGDRVEQVVDLFRQNGIDFPYERLPLEHEFPLFVEADRRAGWPTLRWMNQRLGTTD
ncbi:alpha/beta hydrolase [Kineococcus gynurae]|uniref:Alpha/beta hydrolase n=1 Tax=Kineococcus gynurae TaxID=452979 RepID=A0ABV5LWG0_9ACTN